MSHLDSIALGDAMSRAEKVEAGRRALALLLAHHGDIPPEPGCSAEARRIRRWHRRQLVQRRARNAARLEAMARTAERAAALELARQRVAEEERLDRERERAARAALAERKIAGIDQAIDGVAAAYGLTRAALLEIGAAPRGAQRIERRAQQEAIWLALQSGGSIRAVAHAFGRDRSAIRSAAQQHEKRMAGGVPS